MVIYRWDLFVDKIIELNPRNIIKIIKIIRFLQKEGNFMMQVGGQRSSASVMRFQLKFWLTFPKSVKLHVSRNVHMVRYR